MGNENVTDIGVNVHMHKAFKFRIFPNEEQRVLFSKTFGCVRLVYNHYLDKKTKAYQENKVSLTYHDLAKDLVTYKEERPFLKEVDSIALQQSLRHLDTAYQNFFRNGKTGFPRFKSRKQRRSSYTTICVNNNIRLEAGTIILPKVKAVKIKQHRPIPDNYLLKSATISQTPTGKYYVSILYEYETKIKMKAPIKTIGLDFSMSHLFVSSEEDIKADEEFLRYYRKTEEKLARAQRILSHRQKRSRRYEEQREKIAQIHEKISNQRKDYLHKISREIANSYDYVSIEDLNMHGMSQSLKFGKSVADNGWGMFTTFLKYKLEEQGKQLVKIDKWYPSSKRCHVCGHIYQKLKLSERTWTCGHCHTTHNRDANASINIRNKGMKMLLA
jgi:putative transposase